MSKKEKRILIAVGAIVVILEACSMSDTPSSGVADSTQTASTEGMSEEVEETVIEGNSVGDQPLETPVGEAELTDEYFTQVMGNGNTYYFSGEKDVNGNYLVDGVDQDGYNVTSVVFSPEGVYLGIYLGTWDNGEYDYSAGTGEAVDDAWTEGDTINTFGYPVMDYEGYWEDIAILQAAADGGLVVDRTDYGYYTIPRYDNLIFYLSEYALYDAEEGILGDEPYGVFSKSDAGTIGEIYTEPIELTIDDYINAERYTDEIISEQGNVYGFEKMGWISEFSYNYSLNRLEEQKKQWEYQESKAESQQAALDNGYVPAGYSYEDIARYIDDYIGYKVSWDGGLVTDVTGDMVTVCVSFDNFYGYSTPNYNKSFELDCSQAYFDNGKPLVDDHILFEGTITGMDSFTNYIEVSADSVHVQPY